MKNLHTCIFFFLLVYSPVLRAQAPSEASLTSEKREQYIQSASQFRQNDDFRAAIGQLDSILAARPTDAQILLFKGDLLLQSKRYGEAIETYQELLPLNYETTTTQINLSYALFMNHHPAKALGVAQKAWEGNKENSSAIVNLFNALLWNRYTKKAASFLEEKEMLLAADQVLVLKARLFTTSGDYTQGLQYYDSLVTSYLNKYYVQEFAEVLLGKKENQAAQAVMEKGEKLFSANDKNAFLAKMQATRLQQAGTEFVYFKDIGNNVRIENSVWWQQSPNRKFQWATRAGLSEISSGSDDKTTARYAQVSLNIRWNMAWSAQSEVRLQSIRPTGSSAFTGITGKHLVQYQPNDRRMVGAYVSTDILNFTASLLEKNVRSSNLGYVTHLMLNGNNGFYSQGSWGTLNDNNRRVQIFGSLYHLFRTEPTLKGGINFSALHFKNNAIESYFAPNRYLSTELFADFSTSLPHLAKWYFQGQAAAGMQKIEKNSWDLAYRLQGQLGYRVAHFEASGKYQTSNVASSTGTGYKFGWYTLNLIWKW